MAPASNSFTVPNIGIVPDYSIENHRTRKKKDEGKKCRPQHFMASTNLLTSRWLHFPVFLLICFSPSSFLLINANADDGILPQNCTFRGDKNQLDDFIKMEQPSLECPSLSAFNRFPIGGDQPIELVELNCANTEDNDLQKQQSQRVEALKKLRTEFPSLRQFSLHNCPSLVAQQHLPSGLPPSVDLLNLSGNGIDQFGWHRIGPQRHLQILDLRDNPLDCGKCQNAWIPMATNANAKSQQRQQQERAENKMWPIRDLFPSIPAHVHHSMPSTCTFGHCPVESAKFENDDKMPTLQLGNPLELKCQFRTGNPMNSTVLEDGGIGIFVWPLNEAEGVEEQQNENGQNSTSLFGKTQLLPQENAAVLRIPHLRSEHLGFLACRCPHCWVPQFDLLRLEFPVPLSVHIPPQSSDQQQQQQHMIVHGFPLDGPIRMEITKIEDAENRTEFHEFQGTRDGKEGDLIGFHSLDGQPQTSSSWLFFNDSLVIRPETGHDQFYLRYFSFGIHECTQPHCRHAQEGGQFHFRICVPTMPTQLQGNATEEMENCAEIKHKLVPAGHPIAFNKNDFNLATRQPSFSKPGISFLHLLLSIPPILLSVALLSLGGRTLWRLRQRMAIREKLKRRQTRRASRNTQRTEETSIPLDTMSRSLSLSNYVQSQLHVPLIDSRELQLNERIGKGAFGEVYVAIWRRNRQTISTTSAPEDAESTGDGDGALLLTDSTTGSCGGQQQENGQIGTGLERKVAIKMLTSVQMDAEMDREAALLARLEHPNVLRMFGIAHWSGQIALVLELMNLGDLRNYLRNREPRCNNYAQFPPALLPTELVDIGIQIAEGLCYLAQQQVVHRDLAARNCLVHGDSDMRSCSAAFRPPICVKISDFGMSRRLYASAEYYKMQDKKTALPVRWMPPECLSSGKFTTQSDIWSFGVLLYEVFTFGGMPFAALSNGEVLTAVLGGMRPEVPTDQCRPEMGELMRECWHRNPQKRINALEALQRLRQIQEGGPAPVSPRQ